MNSPFVALRDAFYSAHLAAEPEDATLLGAAGHAGFHARVLSWPPVPPARLDPADPPAAVAS